MKKRDQLSTEIKSDWRAIITSVDPADNTRQGKIAAPVRVRHRQISYRSRGEDSRAQSSGTGRSTCKREDTSRPRSCAYGGGSLSSLMVTATGCRAETARGWSRPRAVSRSGRRPTCSAGSRRRGCSPSRSSVADEGRSGVSGSCCTGTKTGRRCVHFVRCSIRCGRAWQIGAIERVCFDRLIRYCKLYKSVFNSRS